MLEMMIRIINLGSYYNIRLGIWYVFIRAWCLIPMANDKNNKSCPNIDPYNQTPRNNYISKIMLVYSVYYMSTVQLLYTHWYTFSRDKYYNLIDFSPK